MPLACYESTTQKTKRTLANVASILSGEISIRIANFVASIIIARKYGPTFLGTYAAALAFATILGSLADNGLSVSAIPEVKRRLHEIDRAVTSLYVAKTALFIVAIIGAIVIVWCGDFGHTATVIGALLICKVILNSYAALNFAVLKSLERMRTVGIVQVLHACCILCCLALIYRRGYSLTVLLIFLLVAQCAELLVSSGILYALRIRPALVSRWDCTRLIAVSTPLGISTLLASVIQRIDVLAISAVGIASQVGHFASADNGLIVIYLASALFGNVLLPEMAGMDRQCLESFVLHWRRLLVLISLPAAILMMPFTRTLVVMIYGSSFAPAATPAAIMVLATPCILLNALYFNKAIALQLHRVYVFTYVITAIIALIASYTFARAFGPTGVAVAIVCREAFMLMLFIALTRRPPVSEMTMTHASAEYSGA